MARLFPIQNLNPKHQILLAALLLTALAAFLVLRHSHQADASVNHSGDINLTSSGDSQEFEESSAVPEGSSNSEQSSNSSTTNVTVNGRHIDLPQNGSISQTITDENGTTTIKAEHSESSSSSNSDQTGISSNSSVNVKVNSSSTDSL